MEKLDITDRLQIVSEKDLKNASKTGKWPQATIVTPITTLLSNVAEGNTENTEEWQKYASDFALAAAFSITEPSVFVSLFKDLHLESNEVAQEILVDTLWLIGLELSLQQNDVSKTRLKSLGSFVRTLYQRQLISTSLLVERLEPQLLEAANLGTANALNGRLLKLNTVTLYKQQKFNLLREASEGYSKLLEVLLERRNLGRNVDVTMQRMQSLIGYFRLDPNRVLDVVLEAFDADIAMCMRPSAKKPNIIASNFENEPRALLLESTDFLRRNFSLLTEFRSSSILHILGFKLESAFKFVNSNEPQPDIDAVGISPATTKPHSMRLSTFYMVGMLLCTGVLSLHDIWMYLLPNSSQSKEYTMKYNKLLQEQIDSYSSISLSGESETTAKPAADGAIYGGTDTSISGTLNGHAAAEYLADLCGSSEAFLGSPSNQHESEHSENGYVCTPCVHHKIALLESLIRICTAAIQAVHREGSIFVMLQPSCIQTDVQGIHFVNSFSDNVALFQAIAQRTWQLSMEIAYRLAEESSPHPILFPSIAMASCELLDELVKPVVEVIKPHARQSQSKQEVLDRIATTICAIVPLVRFAGPVLANFSSLFCNLCRSVRYMWRSVYHQTDIDLKTIVMSSLSENGNASKPLKSDDISKGLSHAHITLLESLGVQRQSPLAASWICIQYGILPSLSLVGSKLQCANEVWRTLQYMPWTLRYALYEWQTAVVCSEEFETELPVSHDYAYQCREFPDPATVWGWNNYTTEKPGLCDIRFWWHRPIYGPGTAKLTQVAANRASQATRQSLKRVAHDTIKQAARALAKASHSNPWAVFEAALSQLEKYDNLIDLVLDALRYVSPLTVDVIGFLVTQHLASDRSATQRDGLTPQLWLTSMATFAGSFFRKFPSCDSGGVVQMLLHRLMKSEFHAVLPLRELLVRVGGVQALVDISDDQVEGQAGSTTLRAITSMYDISQAPPQASLESLIRSFVQVSDQIKFRGIMNELTHVESSGLPNTVMLPFCLLLSHLRDASIYGEAAGSSYLKVMAGAYDAVQIVLMQYIELLSRHAPISVLAQLTPSIDVLLGKFGMHPELAFAVARPLLRAAIWPNVPDRQPVDISTKGTTAMAMDDIDMTPLPVEHETDNKTETMNNDTVIPSTFAQLWNPFEENFQSRVKQSLSHISVRIESGKDNEDGKSVTQVPLWDCLTPELFIMFWSLSLFDILVPAPRYTSAIESVKQQIVSLERDLASTSIDKKTRDKTGKQLEYYRSAMSKLSEDLEQHRQHIRGVRARLEAQCNSFVTETQRKLVISALLQHCILPRALLTPADALYASTFLVLLHDLSTPRLNSLQAFNLAFTTLVPSLACATEREAVNLGVFFRDLLQRMNVWRDKQNYYMKYAASKVGFAPKINETDDRVSHEKFCAVHSVWHARMTRVFTSSLSTGEYINIKNAFVVLRRMVSVFPVSTAVAEALLPIVRKVRDEENRKDLQTLARGYYVILEKKLKDGNLRPDDDLMRKRLGLRMEKGSNGKPSTSLAAANKSSTTTADSGKSSSSTTKTSTTDSLDSKPPIHTSKPTFNATSPSFAPRKKSINYGTDKNVGNTTQGSDESIDVSKRTDASNRTDALKRPLQETESPDTILAETESVTRSKQSKRRRTHSKSPSRSHSRSMSRSNETLMETNARSDKAVSGQKEDATSIAERTRRSHSRSSRRSTKHTEDIDNESSSYTTIEDEQGWYENNNSNRYGKQNDRYNRGGHPHRSKKEYHARKDEFKHENERRGKSGKQRKSNRNRTK